MTTRKSTKGIYCVFDAYDDGDMWEPEGAYCTNLVGIYDSLPKAQAAAKKFYDTNYRLPENLSTTDSIGDLTIIKTPLNHTHLHAKLISKFDYFDNSRYDDPMDI